MEPDEPHPIEWDTVAEGAPKQLAGVMIDKKGKYVGVREPGGGIYELALSQVDDPVKLLAWTVHLARKTWVTRDHIIQFVTSVSKHFGWPIDTLRS